MEANGKHSFMHGISLVETLVGLAVFFAISVSVYQVYTVTFKAFSGARMQVLANNLANEHLEFIRNIPFSEIGVVKGIPPGIIVATTTVTRENMTFEIGTTVRNIDDPFDGVICPGEIEMCGEIDFSPADYKLIDLSIICTSCSSPARTFRFTGRVAPKGLETASMNGALFIRAIDANGELVSGATVEVVNNTVTPAVNITDTTDTEGYLRIVDVPPATISYQITVSKSGYSTDQTYATSTANPNPIAPPLTVAAQTVTRATFAIDRTSQMNISSLTETCGAVPGSISASLTGSKLIGRDPDVLKHAAFPFVMTGGNSVLVAGLEWDMYTISLAPQQGGYDLAGIIPLSPFSLASNVTQNVKLIMKLNDPQGVLVTVKDAATGLPLTNASVTLGGATYEQTLFTGRGFLKQTDWSSGAGQASFTNPAMYAEDDGNIDAVSVPGVVQLKRAVGGATGGGDSSFHFLGARAFAAEQPQYVPAGFLVSSTFDTGSPSNFYDLAFQPTSQNPATGSLSAKFQFAATNTPNPVSWDFKGPDGTAGTYYAYGSPNIHPLHNGNRYFRYKTYLQTASTTFTPSVSDVSVVFASDCVPPGQVLFSGVPQGTHNLTVMLAGYATVQDVVAVTASWQSVDISLVPTGGGGGGMD